MQAVYIVSTPMSIQFGSKVGISGGHRIRYYLVVFIMKYKNFKLPKLKKSKERRKKP